MQEYADLTARFPKQFFRFLIVGVVVATLDLSVFLLMVYIQMPRTLANAAGMTAGFVLGLLGHHHFTFSMSQPLAWKNVAKYALGFILNFLIGTMTLELCIYLGASVGVGKLISMCLVVLSNFFISRHFVFTKK